MANFVNIDGVNIEDQLLATQDSAGLLSAEDKIKIDNISEAINIKKDKDLIVTISSTIVDNVTTNYSADKTFAEITEAYNKGASVYAITAEDIKCELNKVNSSELVFNYYSPIDMVYYTITITSENIVSVETDSPILTYEETLELLTDTDTISLVVDENGDMFTDLNGDNIAF